LHQLRALRVMLAGAFAVQWLNVSIGCSSHGSRDSRSSEEAMGREPSHHDFAGCKRVARGLVINF